MTNSKVSLEDLLRELPLNSSPRSVDQISKATNSSDKAVRNAIDSARRYYAIFNEPRGFWRSDEPVPASGNGRWKKNFPG